MKQELTIAVVLLAIGCTLLFAFPNADQQGKIENSASLSTSNENASINTASVHDDEAPQANKVVQASFLQELPPPSQITPAASVIEEPEQVAQPSTTNPAKSGFEIPAASQIGFSIQSPDPDAVRLLASAARDLANSKPLKTNLLMTAGIFDQQVSASGTYYQMGQGTHKTRIELTFDSFATKPTLFQICDGRFFYTIHSEPDPANRESNLKKQTLEFVDLLRVQEAAGERPSSITPTGWVATGGLSSLLQHLASGFNFGPPVSIDQSRVMIRGVWDPNALRQIVSSSKKSPDLGNPIQWDRVPKQLPHAVEFVFTVTDGKYFPSQVSFLRFQKQNPPILPTMTLSFSEPTLLSNLADGFFVIDSANLEPTDTTDRYIARIEKFQQTQQAEAEASTLER